LGEGASIFAVTSSEVQDATSIREALKAGSHGERSTVAGSRGQRFEPAPAAFRRHLDGGRRGSPQPVAELGAPRPEYLSVMAQGRHLSLIRLTRTHRVAAVALFDHPPDGECAEQDPYGSFVEPEAGGRFFGGGWKLLKEPYLSSGVEGGDQPPIRDLTRRGQKREVFSVTQFGKS